MEHAEKVRTYYISNFSRLPFDKQFHFASRLAAWNSDPNCLKHLDNLKHEMMPSGTTPAAMLQDIMINLPNQKINAAAEREPYFRKYPALRGRMLALFRVRHLLTIYGVDLRSDFTQLVDSKELHDLASQLLNDSQAVTVLSTYAINYIYLVKRILYSSGNDAFSEERLYEIGNAKAESKTDILLLIYLFTHCIIGESNFYARKIPEQKQPIYQKMIEKVEGVIEASFYDINLDNKLEFLVCCRILGYSSKLSEKIYDECAQSISQEEYFLIDSVNSAGQANKTSFEDSEHRNVLFIMSTMPYQHY